MPNTFVHSLFTLCSSKFIYFVHRFIAIVYLLLVSIFSMLIVVFVHKIREFFTIQNLIDDIFNKISAFSNLIFAGTILN